jgi:hypothetical protein
MSMLIVSPVISAVCFIKRNLMEMLSRPIQLVECWTFPSESIETCKAVGGDKFYRIFGTSIELKVARNNSVSDVSRKMIFRLLIC